MYTADITGAHILLSYSDIFKEEKLDLIEIIKSLNMHKVISIIYDMISYPMISTAIKYTLTSRLLQTLRTETSLSQLMSSK